MSNAHRRNPISRAIHDIVSKCIACHGTGLFPGNSPEHPRACGNCKGTGKDPESHPPNQSRYITKDLH